MHLWLPGTGTARPGRRAMIGLAFALILVFLGLPRPGLAAQDGRPGAAAGAPAIATSVREPNVESNAPRVPGKASFEQISQHSLITDREQLLSYSILIFGVCVLIVQYLLLRSPHRGAYEILQLLSINLIVTGTLFLISAGFAAQQIAPGLGLFGTVAGYVLGRKSSEDNGGDRSKQQTGGQS